MALEVMCVVLYTSCYKFLTFEHVLCEYTACFEMGSDKYNFPINGPVKNISRLYVKVWLSGKRIMAMYT
jgi:hypothetical protein